MSVLAGQPQTSIEPMMLYNLTSTKTGAFPPL
jgi:hypothetical protein